MNVPEGARDAINKEAARKNQNSKIEKDEVVVEQVKKDSLPVKRNEHVVSYVDVMRNYSQDLVRKKKEEEEKRETQTTADTTIPPSSLFPTEALASKESSYEVKREELIKGVIIKGIVCTPQMKGKNKKSGNPFEKRSAPSPPPPPQSEPKTKAKKKSRKSSND